MKSLENNKSIKLKALHILGCQIVQITTKGVYAFEVTLSISGLSHLFYYVTYSCQKKKFMDEKLSSQILINT